MPEISILIPTVGEKTLSAVLDSIQLQSYHDYEIIVVDSSNDSTVADITRKHNVRTLKTDNTVGLLKAKYLASQVANGNFLLFLDATKALKPSALSVLAQLSNKNDMLVVLEEREGAGKLTYLSKLDKQILSDESNLCREGKLAKYLVPRFYKKSLAIESLERVKTAVGDYLFNEILWPEDRLLFYQATKKSASIGITKLPLIMHIGDDTFRSVSSKYRRYGRSYRLLKAHKEYSNEINLSRIRSLNQLNWQDRVVLWQLYLLRFVSFHVGYYLG
jgi:glycosyltransferase involved in cell wall biosynthesis